MIKLNMMKISDKVKDVGYAFAGFGIFFGIILLVYLTFTGGVWLGATIYPIIATISGIVFVISILILLPLGLFHKTRSFAGNGLVLASWIIGFSTWIWSFLLTYSFWGLFGLFVGLIFAGIGVLPIAMIASLFNAKWALFAQLLISVIVIYGFRILGIYLLDLASHHSKRDIDS
jgi:hypothetical protein